MNLVPMGLLRIPEPFDHADFLFELKYDGFRALTHVEDDRRCRLISRNGHEFKKWHPLADQIAGSIRARSAILDGDVCLDPDGRPNFYKLLFRRQSPVFMVFDLLELDGEDLRGLPLVVRKGRLKSILPPSYRPATPAFSMSIISSARDGPVRSHVRARPGRHRREVEGRDLPH